MRITDAKQGMGKSVARAPSLDRNAYRSGGNVGAALMGLVEQGAETMAKLELAEEEAKADELRTEYEIEYNGKVAELEAEHRNNNFAATEYDKRHQKILTDLKSKYSTAHSFNTVYGKNFNSFLENDGTVKQQRYQNTINEVALQNQQVSWAKGEMNRMNAAVGGDYQTLQNMIAEQRNVYNTPQYQVAYGAKAVIQQQNFIDQSSSRWVKSQLAKGSDPKQMLRNMQQENMFVGISEDSRANITLSLQQEVKRREAAAAKAAKEAAKLNEITTLANGMMLAGGMDPKNKKHKAAFEHLLKQEVQDSANPAEALQRARNLRIEYGFIEPSEVSSITATFNSGDFDRMQLAIQSVEHYVRAKPQMAEYFNDEIRKVTNLVSSGYSAARAVEIYQQMENMPQHRKDALNAQLKDKDLVAGSVKNVSTQFEELWDMDSTLGMGGWDKPAELDRVSEQVFKTQFVLYNGNTEAAEKATLQFMAKNWGVTNIGGEKRFMYQSPSSYLKMRTSKEFEPDAIKDIFVSELVEYGIPPASAERAEIYRIPADDSNGNPKYQVLIDGQVLLNKQNKPQAWTFDVNSALKVLADTQAAVIEEERLHNIGQLSTPNRKERRAAYSKKKQARLDAEKKATTHAANRRKRRNSGND